MSAPLMLRGVDRAAFAAALVARLHGGGVGVSADGPAGFVRALRVLRPLTRVQLYWAARLTLVNRMEDLAAFDAVFDAVFADTAPKLEPPARTPGPPGRAARWGRDGSGRRGGAPTGAMPPWATGPTAVARAGDTGHAAAVPDVLPSRIVARADQPFDRFDPDDVRLIGSWLEQAAARWPRRRTLRGELHQHGSRIDLRKTMQRSRATGWEAVLLARTRQRQAQRRVVLVCDVSRSMQPYAAIYLHLMRAWVLRRAPMRPEVFVFSTSLTRLTPSLSHRSPELALARANAKVTDRYGGTHLGRCIGALPPSPHGNALRGAVVIIASDGWDADPPEVLERALARVRRRAERVVWLNPRAASRGFQPLAGSMAAALPYCDVFLPAHSLTGLRDLFAELSRD